MVALVVVFVHTELEIRVDADSPKTVRSRAHDFRMLKKVGLNFAVFDGSLENLTRVWLHRRATRVDGSHRRKVDRNVEAVARLLDAPNQLVALVHVLFSCLQVQSVQVSLQPDVVGY